MVVEVGDWIEDILEVHFEELEFLWNLRRLALRSPEYDLLGVVGLEERIQAHADALVLAGENALPILMEGLDSDDRDIVTAATFVLLKSEDENLTRRPLSALADATGEKLDGLRDGMCYGPLGHLVPQLEETSRAAPSRVAVAAAQALAFHSALQATAQGIQRFLADDEQCVRKGGWRLVGHLGLSLDPKTYATAMRDDDPDVRSAAVEAGAWCAEPGILALGRKLAVDPTPDNLVVLEMLAILGGPDDLHSMETIGRAQPLGPERFRLLGTYGNPALMELILQGIGDPDPAISVAAASAFTKMTGKNIESDERATLPPSEGSEPDEFEAEFLDEVTLPSFDAASAHWESIRTQLSGAPRLCKGFDLRNRLDQEEFAALDMESRREVCLRSRFSGSWEGSPLSLEVFPQRRPGTG